MALWCKNFLTVTGNESTLAAFDKQFRKTHTEYEYEWHSIRESEFDKDAFLSDDKYIAVGFIRDIRDTANGKTPYIYANCIISETTKTGYSFHNFIPITKDDYLNSQGIRGRFIETKIWGDNEFVLTNKFARPSEIQYRFDTNAHPPHRIIKRMSWRYPTLTFEYKFYASWQHAGYYILKNGRYTESRNIALWREDPVCDEKDQQYKRFLLKYGMDDFVTCPNCSNLLDFYYVRDDSKCYLCGVDIPDSELRGSSHNALSLAIEELNLSVRSYNILKRAGIHTVSDILNTSDDRLRSTRNMGRRCFEEIKSKLCDIRFS